MRRVWGVCAVFMAAIAATVPASAEQVRIEGYYPAANDEAAALRSIAVADFGGEDGPHLALAISDALREVEIDRRPWFTVLAGRRGRDADGELGGVVRTRFVEEDISLGREVCVAYDSYDNCTQRARQQVPCLRVTAYLRPDLRLTGRGGQLIWRWSQEASRAAEYCPDHDREPDFSQSIDDMANDFARTIRFELAPSYQSRNVRVMEGRGDLPQPLRDPYRNAIRQTQRDMAGACAAFASLLPQAPTHQQLVFNNGLCAEWRGDFDAAVAIYSQLANGRGAGREGRDGLARIEAYRRAREQIARRGG